MYQSRERTSAAAEQLYLNNNELDQLLLKSLNKPQTTTHSLKPQTTYSPNSSQYQLLHQKRSNSKDSNKRKNQSNSIEKI